MSLFIKLSGNVPTLQKSLFRNLVAAFVALILLLKDKPAIGCTKKSFGYVFGRALFGNRWHLLQFLCDRSSEYCRRCHVK